MFDGLLRQPLLKKELHTCRNAHTKCNLTRIVLKTSFPRVASIMAIGKTHGSDQKPSRVNIFLLKAQY